MGIENTSKENFVTSVGLTEINNEPRAQDLELAERLGFDRPRDIRKLIDRNRAEIDAFGVCATVARTSGPEGGRPATEYWLNEEQALLVSVLSKAPNAPAVRAMLIKVFVAWRRGHLDQGVMAVDYGKIGRQMAAIVHDKLHEAIKSTLPDMVRAQLARGLAVRQGKTAGQIWQDCGLSRLKNAPTWLGNRLAEMGAAIDHDAMGELGLTTARLFDPDRAAACMRNGLKMRAERYVAERKGQGVLKLVPKGAGEGASG